VDDSLDVVEFVSRDGVIENVSSAISVLAGYAPSDLIGRDYKDILHPQDCELAEQTFATVLKLGHAGPVTLRYRQKTGAWRTVRVTARDHLGEPAARAIVILTRDITEQLQAEASLAVANSELHYLSQRLLVTQDAERSHLARELHDDIGQILVGLRLSMDARADSVPASLVARWGATVAEALEHLRQLTGTLRPISADDGNLPKALAALVERLREATERDIRVKVGPELVDLPTGVNLACCRIVQEALSNALKHSGAMHIGVSADRVGNLVRIDITDDGKGFDLEHVRARTNGAGGMGLLTMRERAALAAGMLVVESSPTRGTRVHVELPVEAVLSDSEPARALPVVTVEQA